MTKPRSPDRKPNRPPRRKNRGQRQGLSRGAIAALVGLGIAVVALVGVIATNTNSTEATGSTEPAAFNLPAIGDSATRIRLADFAGKPIVVNFFASWCTACDAELPGFSTVSRELEGQVTFVGINALETGDPMLMPERHHITWWPLARDIGGRDGSGLHDALGGRGMPLTAFYDTHGKLLHVDGGALPEQSLRQRINDLYGINT